jgi:hypothetical protein
MRNPKRLLSHALLICTLAPLALTGCGGSKDSITHIRGSSLTIEKPMLDHWMRVVVGTDFRVNVGTKGPVGLAGEPADPSACAAAAKKVVPRSPTGRLELSDAQIAQKCRQLHEAIRAQAMSYLLSAQWAMLEAKELGIHLSNAELLKEFLRWQRENYQTDAKFQLYMKERQMHLADVLFQLRRNLLVTRILPSFEARVKRAGGGEKVYTRLALQRYHGLIAKTTCEKGYEMEDCNSYRAPAQPLPSPAVILEGFAQAKKT